MAERTVRVWDKPFVVDVEEVSKTVWIVAGEYMGQRFESTGRTASEAVAHSRRWARDKGNP
jgi:hypothetical protein